MNKITIGVIGVCLIFGVGYEIGYRHMKIQSETYQKTSTLQIQTLQRTYTQKIAQFQQQMQAIDHRDVVTSKIVYLPSGEKIETKVIDKSVIRKTETRRATEQVGKSEVLNSSLKSGEKIEDIKSSSPVSYSKYKLMLVGIQPQNIDNINSLTSGSQIYGGIRIFSLPAWIDIGTSISSWNKISNVRVGFEIEF